MIKMIVMFLAVFLILYVLKVPQVVSFIDGILQPTLALVSYVIDAGSHVRERHPFLYIGLFFVLLFLMRGD